MVHSPLRGSAPCRALAMDVQKEKAGNGTRVPGPP